MSVSNEFVFFREGGSEIYIFHVDGDIRSYSIPLKGFKSGTYYMETRARLIMKDGTIMDTLPCNTATLEGCLLCGPYAGFVPWKLRIKPSAPLGPIIISDAR